MANGNGVAVVRAPNPDDAVETGMLDYEEASERTGLPIGTLRAHVCNGTIPHYRLGPRTVRFDAHQLEGWIAKHAVATTGSGKQHRRKGSR